jgi:glycosyltransferase involved in cell wall biosynthesis
MQRLLEDTDERERLRRHGLAYVDGLSWEASARQVEAAIRERVMQAAEGMNVDG